MGKGTSSSRGGLSSSGPQPRECGLQGPGREVQPGEDKVAEGCHLGVQGNRVAWDVSSLNVPTPDLDGVDNLDAHRLALSYASSKPVREASEESPRTKRAWSGVQSRPTQEPPEAVGRDMGAGEAAFDGASPLPTHCHLWVLVLWQFSALYVCCYFSWRS